MGIIAWLVFGALAGWVASILVGRNKEMGIVANIVVGIIGALIGGWIMSALGGTPVTGFNLGSFVTAVVGAIVLLVVVGMVRGR
ncbi:MAG: GlsB/YeaQ/YmgE family stress response membrane protein [Caldilineaceae bacterium]|nr:GlsB/YeaQ/YmgE family stress response membrane protein [Caldilineaceae bacterium]